MPIWHFVILYLEPLSCMWHCSLPDGSVDKMRKEDVENKKKKEITSDKQKEKKRRKVELFTLPPQLPSLRDKSREGKEENIFQRHVPLHTPLRRPI